MNTKNNTTKHLPIEVQNVISKYDLEFGYTHHEHRGKDVDQALVAGFEAKNIQEEVDEGLARFPMGLAVAPSLTDGDSSSAVVLVFLEQTCCHKIRQGLVYCKRRCALQYSKCPQCLV